MDYEKDIISNIIRNIPSPYKDYFEAITPSEVPVEFHPFAFLTGVASLIGKSAYFLEGIDKVHPNLWTLLVGSSSITRKSTSIRPIEKLLSTTNVKVLPTQGSPEGYFRSFGSITTSAILMHSELGGLIKPMGSKDYMGGLAESFCDMYDPGEGSKERVLARESITIKKFPLSWLACTTPHSVGQREMELCINTGFFPRWNIVLGRPVSEYVSFRKTKGEKQLKKVGVDLQNIISYTTNSKPVEVIFPKETLEAYHTWYISNRKHLESNNELPSTSLFWVRVMEVVKKYSVVLAIMKKQTTISLETLNQAIEIGRYFFLTSKSFCEDEVSLNFTDKIAKKALLHLVGTKLTARELQQKIGTSADVLEKCLKTQKNLGNIGTEQRGKTWVYFLI